MDAERVAQSDQLGGFSCDSTSPTVKCKFWGSCDNKLIGLTSRPARWERARPARWERANVTDLPQSNIETETLRLTGPGGSLYLWHSNLLHGTQPNLHDKPRISLRNLVEKNTEEENDCPLDNMNKIIKGSLKLTKTRRDLEEKLKVNFINKSV